MKHPLVVYYDGWCPLCIASAAHSEKWDWFKLVQFVSFRDLDLDAVDPPFPEGLDFEKRIVSRIAETDRYFEGIQTVIQIAMRIPLYYPLVPILTAGIQLGMGQKVYDWIAVRRMRIPVGHCTDGSCELVRTNPKTK